jgi:hypothetical protein
MLSIQECREILEAKGWREWTDHEIEHLRYVLIKIAALRLRLEGIEVELPAPPSVPLQARVGANTHEDVVRRRL